MTAVTRLPGNLPLAPCMDAGELPGGLYIRNDLSCRIYLGLPYDYLNGARCIPYNNARLCTGAAAIYFPQKIGLLFILTMYFNAGLIPNYFLIKNMGLLHNFMVYILPSLVSAFNLIIMRTYIRGFRSALPNRRRLTGRENSGFSGKSSSRSVRLYWQLSHCSLR